MLADFLQMLGNKHLKPNNLTCHLMATQHNPTFTILTPERAVCSDLNPLIVTLLYQSFNTSETLPHKVLMVFHCVFKSPCQ